MKVQTRTCRLHSRPALVCADFCAVQLAQERQAGQQVRAQLWEQLAQRIALNAQTAQRGTQRAQRGGQLRVDQAVIGQREALQAAEERARRPAEVSQHVSAQQQRLGRRVRQQALWRRVQLREVALHERQAALGAARGDSSSERVREAQPGQEEG